MPPEVGRAMRISHIIQVNGRRQTVEVSLRRNFPKEEVHLLGGIFLLLTIADDDHRSRRKSLAEGRETKLLEGEEEVDTVEDDEE